MSKILLIAGNYFPEPTGIGKYNGEMIKWLAEHGNACTVITTFPYYPQWKIYFPYRKRCFWFKTDIIPIKDSPGIKVIRCPHYVPKNPSGKLRLISEFSFFFSAYLVVIVFLFKRKFNYTMTVAPPFEIGVLGVLYNKIKGSKFLYHIQDLQIDAARDLGMIKSRALIKAFLKVERIILKKADFVSTISNGMVEKVKEKINRQVFYFPNWADTEFFYPINTREKKEIKGLYGFKDTDKIFLYSGAIGHKQGLEMILNSAKNLEHLSDVKFIICGDGPYKEKLKDQAHQLNLKNIRFLPIQKTYLFNSFLNMADFHFVIEKINAGNLFLPSKLCSILSVGGVAIVAAGPKSSLSKIMQSSNMGILIEPENQEALNNAIINYVYSGEMVEKAINARLYAESHLEINKILGNFFSEVLNSEPVISRAFTGIQL